MPVVNGRGENLCFYVNVCILGVHSCVTQYTFLLGNLCKLYVKKNILNEGAGNPVAFGQIIILLSPLCMGNSL